MLILNESYDDKIMRLRYEMLLMRSKTGQALGLDKAEDFDSALDEASRPEILRVGEASRPETLRVDNTPSTEPQHRPVSRRQISTGRGTLMVDIDSFVSARARRMQGNVSVSSAESNTVLAGTVPTYWRNDFFTGRDTMIAEAAQKYAQAMDISGQHDTVFVAPA